MSLYVSPPGSEEGGTPQFNVRPQLNESLFDQVRAVGFVPPAGTFANKGSRETLESKQWGNAPFFINAKPASMLERGWVRSMNLIINTKGLLTTYDGPEMLVKIIKDRHYIPGARPGEKIGVITLRELGNPENESFDLLLSNWHELWEFYIPTEAIPFVPRKGGSRKIRKTKKSRKMRRKA